ncbi:hypothetical protein TNIN_69901 [Trichonephila inaurata madagascariensis]|uniref:Uncharacterized protein n=1 Tax=Trichonephila inaurata madagascariensis TaxID=2747483 RepID=A0A8X6X8P1_9ARAC|nr:hypothetical protein TNIN_69901 [Trichonephila inaurata madagascariensis]
MGQSYFVKNTIGWIKNNQLEMFNNKIVAPTASNEKTTDFKISKFFQARKFGAGRSKQSLDSTDPGFDRWTAPSDKYLPSQSKTYDSNSHR